MTEYTRQLFTLVNNTGKKKRLSGRTFVKRVKELENAKQVYLAKLSVRIGKK